MCLRFVLPFLGGFLCATAAAQNGYQSTTYGNSSLGGHATGQAVLATYRSGNIYYATTHSRLAGNVNFLTRSSNVGDVFAQSWRSKEFPGTFGAMAAGVRVLAAGNVVYQRNLGASGSLGTFATSFNVFPSDVVVALSMSGIPITLRGNVGAYLSHAGQATMSATMPDAGLLHQAVMAQNARCAVAGGAPGFTVGLEFAGQLPHQSLQANLQARALGTSSATAFYTREALRLRLAVVLNYFWQRFVMTLADASMPRLSRDLMRP